MEKVNVEFRLQHPRDSQLKVNQAWRELKRYLIMAAVFGKVEMFNSVIDELWHIMLNYRQEYDEFCQAFIGRTIQHHPHSEPVFKPDERTLLTFTMYSYLRWTPIPFKNGANFSNMIKG